ncbi:MAG: MBL fold metallo-hydrolase [Deltaproteobacteria bacterium]|nr:MBL fold metallo-hydrolase [Deltaproteobacteria bacterium]
MLSHRSLVLSCLFCVFLVAVIPSYCGAQQNFDQVQIQTERLAEGVYMLTGAGGNIGVCAGEDGVLMIDSQYASLTDKIRAAIAALSDRPIRFLINTHWHSDHTDGNENLAKAGAVIFAHENVRKRMRSSQSILGSEVPPSPKAALPVATFDDGMTFHLNGHEIEVFYIPCAHTDGDVLVRFVESNVLHMGDIYFEGMYPFIDLTSGGSIDGMISAVDQVLAIIDSDTIIIPGHGPLSNKKKLEGYRKMLAAIRERVAQYLKDGKTLEEILAAKPAQDYDAAMGQGFMNSERFVEIVYNSLKK